MQKVNPSELALLELHLNLRFLGIQLYNLIVYHASYSQILAFFEFKLSPEILL